MTQQATILISGRVQGVFFRSSAMEEAQRLGLEGWVRNLPDGGVELVAEGPRTALDELIRWCHEGPPMAHVDNVQVRWQPATGEFGTFRVVR